MSLESNKKKSESLTGREFTVENIGIKSVGRKTMLNKHHSEKTKKLLAEQKLGIKKGPNSKEHNMNISIATKGKSKPWMTGDKNPGKRPEVIEKRSGKNHWMHKEENKRSCEVCGIKDISKSNYTRWHGKNCKKEIKWLIIHK